MPVDCLTGQFQQPVKKGGFGIKSFVHLKLASWPVNDWFVPPTQFYTWRRWVLLQGSPIRHRVLIGTGSRVHTGVGGDAAGRETVC